MAKKPTRLVHCISLGCPRNLVDSEVMLGLLGTNGYTPTPHLEKADVIIVNTCGFLDAARRESLDVIRSALAKKNPQAKVIVAGCLSHASPEALDELRGSLHCVVGSGDVEKIVEAASSEAPSVTESSARSYLEQGEVPRLLSTPPHYAYCKIAEGCRKACSYCIIPHIKGPLRSRQVDDVVREISNLVDRGAFEIILIAQDLGDFGKDLGFSAALLPSPHSACKNSCRTLRPPASPSARSAPNSFTSLIWSALGLPAVSLPNPPAMNVPNPPAVSLPNPPAVSLRKPSA